MKLIDKDALVQYLTGMVESACCDKNVERIIRKFIIPHINSLEVKEVDHKPDCKMFPRPVECYSTCKDCPWAVTNNKEEVC